MAGKKQNQEKMKRQIREYLSDKPFFVAFLIGTANTTGNSEFSAVNIGWAMDLPHEVDTWPDGFVECAVEVFEEMIVIEEDNP